MRFSFDTDNILDVLFLGTRILVIILCLSTIVITIIRMCAKPFTLKIQGDSLSIRNRTLKTADIKEIRVQGYFKPLIGIIPVGKRITPINLVFRFFSEEEDRAIKELTEWANVHQVKVKKYTQIKRWV
ncbi:hypothetical protein ACK8P5_10780 [Paenibacillus sp. EC2-1]|uniref:hypothetical protein n=1 Tax=Paenibacillus sp. EC2-1 TaxID=3388665 RepID=UPI003BEECEBC